MKIFTAIFFILAFVLVGSKAAVQSRELIDKESREFVNIHGDYYYISPMKMTTREATKFCNILGMRLISFQSKEKQERINKYLQYHGHENTAFWTSGIRYYESDFLWSGIGKMFTFTNWLSGNPKASLTLTDICVALDSTGQWQDTLCSFAQNFICEE